MLVIIRSQILFCL